MATFSTSSIYNLSVVASSFIFDGGSYIASGLNTSNNALYLNVCGGSSTLGVFNRGSYTVVGTDDADIRLGSNSKKWNYTYVCCGLFDCICVTNVQYQNPPVNGSDCRIKCNITSLNDGISLIKGLKPVSYQFCNVESEKIHFGLIAQDVNQILDKDTYALVNYDNEHDQYGLRYDELISPLIKSVQELKDIIDAQASEIEDLKFRINVLEQK